jgi:hypothetical protein
MEAAANANHDSLRVLIVDDELLFVSGSPARIGRADCRRRPGGEREATRRIREYRPAAS